MKRAISLLLTAGLILAGTAQDVSAFTENGPVADFTDEIMMETEEPVTTGAETGAVDASFVPDAVEPEEAPEEYGFGAELLGEGDPYKVIFHANNGTEDSYTQNFKTGETQQLHPNDFTKKGYSFRIWSTVRDGSGDTYNDSQSVIDLITGPGTVDLYAQWYPNVYTIRFDPRGGKCSKTEKEVTYDETYGSLPTPSRTHYEFKGWFTDPEDGSQVTAGDTVRILTDQNLYAHWEPETYTVRFDSNGGTEPSPIRQEVTYGEPYGTLPSVTREHYAFLGWYTALSNGDKIVAADKVTIGKDHTLYALWEGDAVNITFNVNKPSAASGDVQIDVTKKTVHYGGVYGEIPRPVLTGYRFDGWYTKPGNDGSRVIYSTEVTETTDQTLYAHWTLITYVISFKPNGGSCEEIERTVTHGKKFGDQEEGFVDFPEPVNDGYVFTGWFTGTNGGDQVKATDIVDEVTCGRPTKGLILYAHWVGKMYRLTLNANGGKIRVGTEDKDTVTRRVVYNKQYDQIPDANDPESIDPYTTLDTMDLQTPELGGHAFLGWFTEAVGGKQIKATDVFKNTSDETLYAHWKVNNYTIKYNANGGVCKSSGKIVVFGSAYGDLASAEREGYEFSGWFTKPGDDGVPVTPETIVSLENLNVKEADHYLYAHWYAKEPWIFFDPNGGSIDPADAKRQVTYLDTYGTLPDALRDCYDLVGWFTKKEGGDQIFEDTVVRVSSNQTLYAHWEGKTYTVKFNPKGGTCYPVSKDVKFAEEYGTLPTPTRTGYDFDGWFTQEEGGKQIESTTVVSEENLDPSAAEHVIYAHWTVKTYTVFFDPNGGNCSTTSMVVTFDAPYGELPEVVMTGSDFGGWWTTKDDSGVEILATTPVSKAGNHTLYAHWDGQPYTLTFHPGEGTLPGSDTKTIYYGKPYGALPEPELEGHNFNGWYPSPEGGNRVNEKTRMPDPPGDQDVYADYVKKRFSITFYGNGGNWNGEGVRPIAKKQWKDVILEKEAIVPKYSRHNFIGWYQDPECTIPYVFGTEITSDVKIYAKWEPRYLTGFDVKGLSPTGYYYSGQQIKPEVEVYDYDYDDETPLVQGKDYRIYYYENTKVGKAYLVAKGIGNYTDSITKEYDIVGRDISKDGPFADEFHIDDIYVKKINKGQKPTIAFYRNRTRLALGKEFTASWVNEHGEPNGACKEAGTYTVTLTGIGNYAGERTFKFVILNDDQIFMNACRVRAENRDYDGTADEPAVTVTWNKRKLTRDVDYEILWPGQTEPTDPIDTEAMTNAGTVTFTIRGIQPGTYAGTIKGKYQILGETIQSSWIIGMPTRYEYTGGEKKALGQPDDPEHTGDAKILTPYGYELKKGQDYTVSYSKDTVNIGTVTMTVKGHGKYLGTVTRTYRIVQAALKSVILTGWNESVNYVKGGNYPKPKSVTLVAVKGATGREGVDYTLSYKNNTKPGTATMTVTGIGNFKGKISRTFVIKPQNIGQKDGGEYVAVKILMPNVPYSGKPGVLEAAPIITDKRTGLQLDNRDYSKNLRFFYAKTVDVTQKGTPGTVKRMTGEAVGKTDIVPVNAKLYAVIDGTGGFTGSARTEDFFVNQLDLSKEKVQIRDQYYTGEEIHVPITDIFFLGGKKTAPPTSTDYEIIGYKNNIQKGTATVILKGKNNFGGFKTATFKIVQRPFEAP